MELLRPPWESGGVWAAAEQTVTSALLTFSRVNIAYIYLIRFSLWVSAPLS